MAANDPVASDEARRRLDYIRGWERAGYPSRTHDGIEAAVRRVFEARQANGAKLVDAAAPSTRQVLRWISTWVNSGGDIDMLVPQSTN